ncbi:MAG: InlB B-repeat-containing protein [Methanobrevibacter sp.]|nr:InlB B-repeat-containing protein [Methanobrevibacter sp.]
MNSSKRIFTLLILFVSILIFSTLTVSAVVVSEKQTYTIDNGNIQIEAKYKKITTYKVTFNANGGKVGTKIKVAKNFNKGAKIKKFPATPKRTGYTFKGWYTKKTGGKKITVNTKPTKSVTLYAQWKKKTSSRVLTAEDKKLIGTWTSYYSQDTYSFSDNGRFIYHSKGGYNLKTGNYKAFGGKITFTNIKWTVDTTEKLDYPTTVAEYKIEKTTKVEYLKICSLISDKSLTSLSKNYLPLSGSHPSPTTYTKNLPYSTHW